MFNARIEIERNVPGSSDPVMKLRASYRREGQFEKDFRGFRQLESLLSQMEFQRQAYEATAKAYNSRQSGGDGGGDGSDDPTIGRVLQAVGQHLADFLPVLREAVAVIEHCHWN